MKLKQVVSLAQHKDRKQGETVSLALSKISPPTPLKLINYYISFVQKQKCKNGFRGNYMLELFLSKLLGAVTVRGKKWLQQVTPLKLQIEDFTFDTYSRVLVGVGRCIFEL